MGARTGFWAVTVTGLKHGPMWVLTRAALSCMDETGALNWSLERLAHECRMTVRTLETHLPLLAKLDLLKRADRGFRVVGWVRCRKTSTENFSEKSSEMFSEERKEPKERSIGKEDMERPPVVPLEGDLQTRKRDRRERNRDRLIGIDRPELQPFTLCWCELCPLPHYWKIQETGYAGEVQELACPEWREKLKAVEVKA